MEQVDLRLYAIVDPEHTGGHDLVDLARAVVAGGATLVQLRDKVSRTPDMIEEARALKAALAPFGVPLIINDRVDVALAVGAGPSSRRPQRRSPFSIMSGSAGSMARPPRRAARRRSGSTACAA